MIYIKSLHIENYKCYENVDVEFNNSTNIIVGSNEAGKSTILEALNLCLSGLVNGRYIKNELNECFFNKDAVEKYRQNINGIPPYILIEVYLDATDSNVSNKVYANLKGSRNSKKQDTFGVKLGIMFDENYSDEYAAFKQVNSNQNVPIEYYRIEWKSFADQEITSRSIPIKPNVIDSSGTKYKNGSDYYISKIISNRLDKSEQISLMQAFRDLKESFKSRGKLTAINEKIAKDSAISGKNVSISVNTTEMNAWENILITYFDEIPFTQIGQGEQSIIKTNLALSNIREDISNVVLIEEPENHLAHTNLNYLLKSIEESNKDRQIIITTHSSFVANKLGLGNLIFLNKRKPHYFKSVNDDTQKYFRKLAGFETLRLILSNKTILVEGPSDELIVQKAYMQKHNGHLPIQDNIDVISVKGIQAKRFLSLVGDLPIRIAVVTDNDGDYDNNITARYKDFTGKDNIGIFSNNDNNQYTLEPSFVACNDEEKLKKFLNYNGQKAIGDYMQTCKSEWAYRIFSEENEFSFPQYINDCIDWIEKNE